MNQTRGNAKSRNINFNINKNEILKIYSNEYGYCALSRMKLTFDTSKPNIFSNISIDRIDSSKTYTYNNVQLLTGLLNKMKSDFNDNDFIILCGEIYYGLKVNYIKKFSKI